MEKGDFRQIVLTKWAFSTFLVFLGDFNTPRPVLGGFLPMGFRRRRPPLPALFLNDPEEKGAVLRHD